MTKQDSGPDKQLQLLSALIYHLKFYSARHSFWGYAVSTLDHFVQTADEMNNENRSGVILL